MSLGSRLLSLARSALRSPTVRRTARDLGRSAVDAVQERRRGTTTAPHHPAGDGSRRGEVSGALADRSGAPPLDLDHSPKDDDAADPGEIVWAWVPYEEDITRGKDRPVLVIAREDHQGEEVLIALMLTSRDRGADVHVGERGGTWVDIGSGDWDSRGRASEVRADRLLRLRPGAVRREGAVLDRDRFETVARTVREVHGWDA